jgi:hypothetical protein
MRPDARERLAQVHELLLRAYQDPDRECRWRLTVAWGLLHDLAEELGDRLPPRRPRKPRPHLRYRPRRSPARE